MIIPDMPKVPLEYAMKPEVKKTVHSLEDMFNCIEAVRVFDKKINVLGYQHSKSTSMSPTYHDVVTYMNGEIIKENQFVPIEEGILALATIATLGFYKKRSSVIEKLRKTREYKNKVMKIEQQNMDDIKKAVAPMKLFHVSIEEAEKLLKRPLKFAETGCPEAYIEEPNNFWLMVKAYIIGADHIVNLQSDSSIGTPVKYADK